MIKTDNTMVKIIHKIFDRAVALNQKNILELLEKEDGAKLIDLGCDTGNWTMQLANKVETKNMYGVDIVPERLTRAHAKGIKTTRADLNKPLPFENNFFDVVHANQVIEHVGNLDLFASEIFRILKPGGYAIISTENASSWHNIGAAILGWQIFSLTNLSSKEGGIGNPLALHRNTKNPLKSWTHKTIFNFRGLKEFFQIHGFKKIEMRGAGYYPLWPEIGDLDKAHSHFITLRGHKIC